MAARNSGVEPFLDWESSIEREKPGADGAGFGASREVREDQMSCTRER